MNKKTILIGLALCVTGAFAQTGLKPGIDPQNLDTSVRPGDDFYHYAAGGWLKSHPLDAEHTSNGAFTDLYEQNQKRIQDIILQYASAPQAQGTLEQKIGSLYNLMMDSVRLNREGWAPIKPTLAKIEAIRDRREYQLVTAQLDRNGESTMMFGIGVGADQKDAGWNIVGIGQGGLGLGTRDYYLSDDAQNRRVLEAYRQYLKKLFQMTGSDEAAAEKKMQAVVSIETRIAKVSYDRVKMRDIDANYHKMTYNQLVTSFPGIDWGNVFLASGFPAFDYVDVSQPEPIHEVEAILADTPLSDLKTYAEAKVISGATSQLSDDFRRVAFELSSVLTGVRQDRPRWKRAVSLVSGTLGEAIGKLYVEKYFPESSKQRMMQLVSNLQTALGQRISEATWMSDTTKAQAKDKLAAFIVKIGYPDRWKDYSGLQVSDSLTLYQNLAHIARWSTDDDIARHVNKPVDKSEWLMTPQTINAYYNPTTNEICFPAAILQPPFFDPEADDAANYGAIGAVIGHEMSHGFDDQGAQFDKDGNQHNWWTAEDKRRFRERTKVLADWFSRFEVLPGVRVNGQQTLGENIGDNGGLNIAYRALQNSLAAKAGDGRLKAGDSQMPQARQDSNGRLRKPDAPAPRDGFTPEQRFFLAWARVWASNTTDEYTKYLLTVDVHSPNYARVNAALPMIDAWYKAFNVRRGDKMFVPKNKRARIW